VVEPGTPGAGPKCLSASLDLGPLSKITFSPLGLFKANWSNVVQNPPALVILALALSVNLKAQTLILGTSKSLTSSVTVPTNAKIGSTPLIRLNKITIYYIIKLSLVSLKFLNKFLKSIFIPFYYFFTFKL
jgi:hypothetical protein